MTKLTKVLLILGVVGLVSGCIIDFGGFEVGPLLTVVLPAGAVFLALSIITLVLEKPVAEYDQEHSHQGH